MKSNWHEITPSQFPWEREALEFIRERLPDHAPYEAWSNFEFIADDGSINEVDVLVVTPVGFFMVEIKSHPGRLEGDNSTWIWTEDNGKRKTVDNPLMLTNLKAKRLKSMLQRQKGFKKVSCPFLEPLVFLSSEKAQCHLHGPARYRVCGRDDPENNKKGVIAALKHRDCPGVKPDVPSVNKPQGKAIAQGLEQMGIRPTQRQRKVGDYQVEEMLFQCPKGTYQEWSARHVALKDTLRRVRIYNVALHESEQTRAIIHQAAEREFKLLDQLEHEGILRTEQFTTHELGPALIFRHDPEALRLDHYLARQGESLSVDMRLSLVRQLAEALKFAHGKRIVHRILSPQSILVSNPDSDTPRIKIFNWQLGRQYIATSTSSLRHTFSIHPEQLVEDASLVYMAPESLTDPDSVEPYADVFSLGAITYHLFGGQPPASSLQELNLKLQREKGLDLSAISDGAGKELVDLIRYSTHPQVSARLGTIDNFLEYLEIAEEELTAPEEDAVANPHDARAGERIEGGFLVKKRLGRGGSSNAFLVEKNGREMVLKIANQPDYADRLRAEHALLKRLRHSLVVEAYDLHDIGPFLGMTLQRAGTETLADYLREEGRIQHEFLERFGSDLLDALKYLEDQGVYHRDIKPDNIGIGPLSGKGKHRLTLFDFSLSSTSLDNTRAGTLKYKDPFLELPKARKYDLYAERYSAALTLHEMATGTLPNWGDGKSDAAMLDCEITLQPELFDTGLRDPMASFFEKALRRNFQQRHDNADEMLKAWRAVFEKAEKTHTETHHPDDFDPEIAVQTAELQTQLVTLGLSARAINAMDRLNVVTVEQLLRFPIFKFYRLKGVGLKTRNEITGLARKLHRRFPDIPVDDPLSEAGGSTKSKTSAISEAPGLDTLSVEGLCREILHNGGKKDSAGRPILLAFLGVEGPDGGDWPTQSELGKGFRLTRARIGQVIVKEREYWRRIPSITRVREDLARILNEYGGVMSVPDLAQALIATRGSTAEEPARSRNARAVLRAALEAERGNQSPLFSDYRSRGRVLISLGADWVAYADALGKVADSLADMDPLLPPGRALEKLREVPMPEGEGSHGGENELMKLAVYMSEHAALSSRMELYPREMPALRALRLSTGAIAGAKSFSVDYIGERVHSRYPEAEALPDRPELDALLSEVGLDLLWQDDENGGNFHFRHSESFTLSSGSYGSHITAVSPDTEIVVPDAEARLLDQKLRRAAKEGAFLVLSVDPRRMEAAEEQLTRYYALQPRNFDHIALPALRQCAADKKVKWDVVLRADRAAPDSPDWTRLQRLFALCLPRMESQLAHSPDTLLLTQPGLLARYAQMGLLEHLRDSIGTTHSTLHGLWLLIPEEGGGGLPTLNGQPIPVLSSGQHARIPNSWLNQGEVV